MKYNVVIREAFRKRIYETAINGWFINYSWASMSFLVALIESS